MSSSINPQFNFDQGILHLWSKFGNPSFKGWRVIAQTSSKWGKVLLWNWISHWRSKSITHKMFRDPYQGLLHLWSKFGDPSLNGWWVIARTSDWRTDWPTDGGNDNTRRQQLTLGEKPPNSNHWLRVWVPHRSPVALNWQCEIYLTPRKCKYVFIFPKNVCTGCTGLIIVGYIVKHGIAFGYYSNVLGLLKTLWWRQNGHHSADNIFMNRNFRILNIISFEYIFRV